MAHALGQVASEVLLGLAALYLAAIACLAAGQRRILFPGAHSGAVPGTTILPPDVEEIGIRTSDDVHLRALWAPPRARCGLVVSFHGNGSFPEAAAERFSRHPWSSNGWGILAIAYRGYPGSTGSPSESGIITDGLAAFAEARRRAPLSSILLHGHSLGAAVAIAVAEREAGCLGLYLEAPFASVEALARARFRFVPVSLMLKDPLRSDRRIAAVANPIVIVHGTEDGVVPVAEGRRLAAAGKAVLLDTIAGDHVSIFGARDVPYELFFRGMLAAPAGS